MKSGEVGKLSNEYFALVFTKEMSMTIREEYVDILRHIDIKALMNIKVVKSLRLVEIYSRY